MQSKFEMFPMDTMELNLIRCALKWAYEDKNNPDGIRKKIQELHDRWDTELGRIVDSFD